MSDITWSNSTRKLSELIPQPDNPRQIDSDSARRLEKSFNLFEQPGPIIIGPDNQLYDGHQRLKVWGDKYGFDLEVAVRVASRSLTREEWQQLTTYMHRGAVGRFDFDILLSWGIEENLVDWGFTPEELHWFKSGHDESVVDLDALAEEYGDPDERDFWPSIKVQVSPETFELWNSLIQQTGIQDISDAVERILSCVDTTAL